MSRILTQSAVVVCDYGLCFMYSHPFVQGGEWPSLANDYLGCYNDNESFFNALLVGDE